MRSVRLAALGALLVLTAPACVNVGIPGLDNFFARGDSFVLRGTAAVVDQGGACRVWLGENGLTYHLFQGPALQNDEFDRVVTAGVTSRLQLAVRQDLQVDCQRGDIVEVERVLEIAP